jgi:hypothetical protein
LTGEENKRVYARYIALLNAQDFDALPEVVDPERYREAGAVAVLGGVTAALFALRRRTRVGSTGRG